jgi:hypothetical protein
MACELQVSMSAELAAKICVLELLQYIAKDKQPKG